MLPYLEDIAANVQCAMWCCQQPPSVFTLTFMLSRTVPVSIAAAQSRPLLAWASSTRWTPSHRSYFTFLTLCPDGRIILGISWRAYLNRLCSNFIHSNPCLKLYYQRNAAQNMSLISSVNSLIYIWDWYLGNSISFCNLLSTTIALVDVWIFIPHQTFWYVVCYKKETNYKFNLTAIIPCY